MHPQPMMPGPGQESVWDYPRPPRLEPVPERLRVVLGGVTIAETRAGLRILETSHPPTYYFPPDDVLPDLLGSPMPGGICEWKGRSFLFDVTVGDATAPGAAWMYPAPMAGFEPLAHYLAFYAGPMEACYVGEARVTPQAGRFYGGWITPRVVGPFKGDPGTEHW
ncbi:DUF427 domain-containing protein [Methylobacterium sp. ID0610]|uniref:DUF427 domain-containing protein n=1 Tax=Methylobacterium carpenticola TaxID=3344827 RepID=UPI003697235E